jgi:serine/threonine-protein kinase RsbT
MEYIYHVKAGDFISAGDASSSIKKLLKQLGINSEVVRRIAIASYEAEMNLVIHSLGGHIFLKITSKDITIIAEDKGPGIADIELAMQEGYTTASEDVQELGFGAGMGLPNIKRCADSFYIKSHSGEGTRLEILFLI